MLDSVDLLCCIPLDSEVPSTVLGTYDLGVLCMCAAGYTTHLNARGPGDLRLQKPAPNH